LRIKFYSKLNLNDEFLIQVLNFKLDQENDIKSRGGGVNVAKNDRQIDKKAAQ
jgi:hypothetical protein